MAMLIAMWIKNCDDPLHVRRHFPVWGNLKNEGKRWGGRLVESTNSAGTRRAAWNRRMILNVRWSFPYNLSYQKKSAPVALGSMCFIKSAMTHCQWATPMLVIGGLPFGQGFLSMGNSNWESLIERAFLKHWMLSILWNTRRCHLTSSVSSRQMENIHRVALR